MNLSCQGVLKWGDESDYIFESDWLSKPLAVIDDGKNNCFYLDKDRMEIKHGDCEMNLIALCQNEHRRPGKIQLKPC